MLISNKRYTKIKLFYYRIFGNPRSYKKDLRYLKACSLILDIGCGHGHFAQIDPVRIIGIDINPESIKSCIEKNLNVLVSNALSLPFKDTTFGGVHCSHLIEHFDVRSLQAVVCEINRVLKSQGVLVIKTPMPHKFFFNDPTHVRPYPPAALLELVGLTKDSQTAIYGHQSPYRFYDLFFSRRLLFQPDVEVGVAPNKYPVRAFFKGLGMVLGRFGIRHWEKSEYTIVLQKK